MCVLKGPKWQYKVAIEKLHVFCAVVGWSIGRFIRSFLLLLLFCLVSLCLEHNKRWFSYQLHNIHLYLQLSPTYSHSYYIQQFAIAFIVVQVDCCLPISFKTRLLQNKMQQTKQQQARLFNILPSALVLNSTSHSKCSIRKVSKQIEFLAAIAYNNSNSVVA